MLVSPFVIALVEDREINILLSEFFNHAPSCINRFIKPGTYYVSPTTAVRRVTTVSFSQLSDMFGRKEMLMFLAQHKVFCDYYKDLDSPTNVVELMKESNHAALFF